jgi:hypothetical protein
LGARKLDRTLKNLGFLVQLKPFSIVHIVATVDYRFPIPLKSLAASLHKVFFIWRVCRIDLEDHEKAGVHIRSVRIRENLVVIAKGLEIITFYSTLPWNLRRFPAEKYIIL